MPIKSRFPVPKNMFFGVGISETGPLEHIFTKIHKIFKSWCQRMAFFIFKERSKRETAICIHYHRWSVLNSACRSSVDRCSYVDRARSEVKAGLISITGPSYGGVPPCVFLRNSKFLIEKN